MPTGGPASLDRDDREVPYVTSAYGTTHLGGIRIGSRSAQAAVRPWTVMGVAGPSGLLAVTGGDHGFRKQPSSNIPAFAAEQHREESG